MLSDPLHHAQNPKTHPPLLQKLVEPRSPVDVLAPPCTSMSHPAPILKLLVLLSLCLMSSAQLCVYAMYMWTLPLCSYLPFSHLHWFSPQSGFTSSSSSTLFPCYKKTGTWLILPSKKKKKVFMLLSNRYLHLWANAGLGFSFTSIAHPKSHKRWNSSREVNYLFSCFQSWTKNTCKGFIILAKTRTKTPKLLYTRFCQYNLRNTLHHQVDVDNQFHRSLFKPSPSQHLVHLMHLCIVTLAPFIFCLLFWKVSPHFLSQIRSCLTFYSPFKHQKASKYV